MSNKIGFKIVILVYQNQKNICLNKWNKIFKGKERNKSMPIYLLYIQFL